MSEEKKLALLIDSDNVSAKYAQFIMQEASKHGELIYKRIYGDWEKNNTGWRIPAMNNSIMPVQQNSYIAGKNATDFSMIIDAMDILYTGNVDGFVLVTSDSDFTRLAIRLRESGMLVIGIGEVKTPLAFTSSCHSFSYLNQICGSAGEYDEDTLRKAVLSYVKKNDDGKLDLETIKSYLTSRYGNIDYDALGYGRLSMFVDNIPELKRKGTFVGMSKISKAKAHFGPQTSAREITDVIVGYLKRQKNGSDDLTKIKGYVNKVLGKIDYSRFGSKRFAKFVDAQSELVRDGNTIGLADNREKSPDTPETHDMRDTHDKTRPDPAPSTASEPAPAPTQEPKVKSAMHITTQLFGMEVKKYAEENGEKGGNMGQLNNMLLEKYGESYVADMGFADFASAVNSVQGVKVAKNFVSIVKETPAKNKPEKAENAPEAADNAKQPAPRKVGRPKKNEKTDLNSVKRDIFEFVVSHDNKAQLAALGNFLAKKYGHDYLKELEFSTFKKLLAAINGVGVKGDTVSLGKNFIKRTQEIEKFIYDFARGDDTKSIKALTMQLKKKYSDFSFTDYGYYKFSDFINAIDGVRANGYYVEPVE